MHSQHTDQIDHEYVDMRIDTGAAVSVIPEGIYLDKLSKHPLVKSKVVLKTYSEERLQLLGEVKSPVQYQSQRDTLTVMWSC